MPNGALRVYEYAGHGALVPLAFTDYASADASPESGKHYTVFTDPVGQPLQIEDAKGQLVWFASRVDPYGHIEVHPASQLEYNLRWPGHYYDPETALHYNRYRYYDPALGRYLQTDPLGYEGSPTNLYGYPANPLTDVDVLGLEHGNRGKRSAPEGGHDSEGREGTTRPRTGGDDGPPPRQPGEPLNSRGLTADQEAHFRQRIDNAPTPEAAADARYERNCTARDNRGEPHLPRDQWQASSDRLAENNERGVRLENAALDDAGVPNNNHGDPPATHPTPDGNTTRPDGVTGNSVIDITSMPDTPHEDGPRVLYDSDQLRGQRDMASSSDRDHVVVMTNGDSSAVRPSGPLADGSTVYHRDSNTGGWSVWGTDEQGRTGWQPCPRPTL
jgi:RHS repeat-associated protein